MSAISVSPSPSSQLVARNLELFNGKKLLVAGAMEDHFINELADHCAALHAFTTDFRLFSALEASSKYQIDFAAHFASEEKFETLLVYLPKAKIEAQYLLANLLPLLEQDAAIYLVGDNRGGIKSAPKTLANFGSNMVKLDSARRCSIMSMQPNPNITEFNINEWLNRFEIQINEHSLTVCSLPGVFSFGELDKGTELLLANLKLPLRNNLLDFGCGAGVIAAYLLSQSPDLSADLVDINALALESARLTLEANSLTAKVYPSDVYSNVEGRFKIIISNPPFHAGLNTHYGATEDFIKQARGHLKIKGRLIIVANKFLRYEPIIKQTFNHCETLKEDNKFKLLSNYAK